MIGLMNKDMGLKNTSTQSPVANMLNEIQKALIRVGATGMQYKFGDAGKIVGLAFGLSIQGNDIGFVLPIRIDKVKAVLKKDNNKRWDDDDYVYRVAWACMRDWVVAQMAMLETEQVDPLQAFLSYAQDKSGMTVYEKITSGNLLLN